MDRRQFLRTATAVAVVTARPLAQAANEVLLDHARTGRPLPPGEFWFTPPLELIDIVSLHGVPGLTILRPLVARPGPLVTLKTTLPGDPLLGLPKRSLLRDLRIVGSGVSAQEYGLLVDAACARIERVEIVNSYLGLAIKWAIDVAVRDSVFRGNDCNVYIPGSGLNTVTTLRFSGCQIREAQTGVLIQNGLGLTFDDRTIIESNRGAGLIVQPRPEGRIADIRCRDVWFENNGRDMDDPAGLVTLDNCWMERTA